MENTEEIKDEIDAVIKELKKIRDRLLQTQPERVPEREPEGVPEREPVGEQQKRRTNSKYNMHALD